MKGSGEKPMDEPMVPIEFGPDGLVPAVIVDGATGDVLMVGFQNREAFDRTRESGLVHFWSRSRGKLWRKGETSGHTQAVREIRVNCENNSLLIEVEQRGAVCHEGYATCYYRRLEPDNTLTVIRDRVFDPADVYDAGSDAPGLAELTRTQMAAYQFLADQPSNADSRTSALLHAAEDKVTPRIADELIELAGVLNGTHVHQDPISDAALEAGQAVYWLTLRAVRDRLTWDDIRPDRALDVSLNDSASPHTLAHLLRSNAESWRKLFDGGRSAQSLSSTELPDNRFHQSANAATLEPDRIRTASGIHASLALVAQALAAFGIDPKDVIARDLSELRTKPYLAPFFAGVAAARQT